jgi:SOS-response transcriptional repressor LexA
MSWATEHIKKLQAGHMACFRPRGNSMSDVVESGDLVWVDPIEFRLPVKVGDIVLCKVKGSHYLHLVSAIKGERYRISNNKGYINGWIGLSAIYGKVVQIFHQG